MENSKETGKVVGAFVVVALLGVVAGMLFAPDKGSKTRAMLLGGARNLADGLSEKVKEEANMIRDKASSLRDKASEIKNMAGEKVTGMANNLKDKIDEVTHLS